jgi:hypothetical protein
MIALLEAEKLEHMQGECRLLYWNMKRDLGKEVYVEVCSESGKGSYVANGGVWKLRRIRSKWKHRRKSCLREDFKVWFQKWEFRRQSV